MDARIPQRHLIGWLILGLGLLFSALETRRLLDIGETFRGIPAEIPLMACLLGAYLGMFASVFSERLRAAMIVSAYVMFSGFLFWLIWAFHQPMVWP